MEHPVGFRFCPTDEEIVDHFLPNKNLGTNSMEVDQVINTVNICSFDPKELPSQSRIKSGDQIWYFFSPMVNKYKRGDRQIRKTKSGFWKKTGVTMNVKRKRGNREKIGEKRVLVFHSNGSKTNWVMHEYQSTSLSPNLSMPYTICKLQFKGEETEISSSSSSASEIDHSLSSVTPMNNSESLISESVELQNPPQIVGSLYEQQEKEFYDQLLKDLMIDDCPSMLGEGADEHNTLASLDEYFNITEFTSQ